MRFLAASFSLYRWPNCILSMAVVFVAGFLLTAYPPVEKVIFAALSAAFITGWGNAINDIRDVESDRINHPNRPLPQGTISIRAAWILALTALVPGTLSAALVNLECLLIATIAAVMLLLYSLGLKRIALISNIWIALISGLTFVFAGFISDRYALPGFNLVNAGAIFAFWFHLAREIVKDLQDLKGDTQEGIRTTAAVLPPALSKFIVVFCFMALALTALAVHFCLKPGGHFLVLFLIGIVAPCMYLVIRLWKAESSRNFAEIAAILKVLMPIGLMVLLSAAI